MKRDPQVSDSRRLVYREKAYPIIGIPLLVLGLFMISGSAFSYFMRWLHDMPLFGEHGLWSHWNGWLVEFAILGIGWYASTSRRLVFDKTRTTITLSTGLFSWRYSKTYTFEEFDAVVWTSQLSGGEHSSRRSYNVSLIGPGREVDILDTGDESYAMHSAREIAAFLEIELEHKTTELSARTSVLVLRIFFAGWCLVCSAILLLGLYLLVSICSDALSGRAEVEAGVVAVSFLFVVFAAGMFVIGVFGIRHGLRNLQEEANRERASHATVCGGVSPRSSEPASIQEGVHIPLRFSGPNSMSHGASLPAKWIGVAIAIIVVLLFTLMGSVSMYLFVAKPIAQVIDARDWPTVPCDIVYSKVKMHSGEGSGYGIEVLYEYEFEGKRCQSSRYEFPESRHTSFGSRKSAQKVVDLTPPNSQTVCYVNRDNPREATLHRGLPSSLWWGLIPLVLLLFPALAIYGLLGSIYGVLKGRRWESNFSKLDSGEIRRQLLCAIVGTCLVLFCIVGVLFVVAWRDVQYRESVPQAIVQQSLAERIADFQSNPQNWRRVSVNTEKLSAKVTRLGGRTERVYRNPATDETLCVQEVFKVTSRQILKHPPFGGYADIASKQIVENWANDKGFLAEEQLRLHLAERFDAGSIHVVTVEDHGDFLTLQLTADCWGGQREFSLLTDGTLIW